MNHLNINQIKEIIPHRHPFLLLDYIEDYVPGEYAVGYKCVSYREEFFEIVDQLEKRLAYAKENTSLPDHPDMKKVEEFVMAVNRRAIDV